MRLGTIGEGMEALITALKDDHPLVRCNAVNALARTCKGVETEIDAASRALSTVMYDDEYAIIREYAISALEDDGVYDRQGITIVISCDTYNPVPTYSLYQMTP